MHFSNILAFGSALVFLVQASSQTEGADSAQNCELNLVQLQAMKNRTKAEVSAGQCTPADEAEMKKFGGGSHRGSFPKVLADCGRKAFRWFKWRRDDMEKCIRDNVKISAPCTKCFGEGGQYGYDNCKTPCLTSWCSERCLGCTTKHDAAVEACVGVDVDVPKPDVC